jgi:hypothetical protein
MNTPGLISDLTKMFSDPNFAPTLDLHAKKLADMYDKFAQSVLDASGDIAVGGDKAQFESTLKSMLTAANGVPPLAALAYEAACTAYWTTAVFGKTLPAPGLLSEITVTHSPHLPGPVMAGIAASLADPSGVAAVKATSWANGFTAGVNTITTTHTGPAAVFPFAPITVGPFPVV